jgi:hypothetical protein
VRQNKHAKPQTSSSPPVIIPAGIRNIMEIDTII